MPNTWDIYLPHAVGLSDMFHRLDSMTSHNKNYPPYNLIKHDSSNYEIQIAAGFKKRRLKYLLNQTFSELPPRLQAQILKLNTYTKECPEDHLQNLGNSLTMLELWT